MATIRDFVPNVQAYARLCPVSTITSEVLDALGELCRKALIWRHVSTMDLVAGTDTYAPTTPAGTIMSAAERVEVYGSTIDPCNTALPNDGAESRSPAVYTVDHEGALRLYPAPAEAGTGALVVTMFLEPASGSVTVPDVFLSRHKSAIVSGALARVLGMVGQPWANPQLALYHVQNFKSEVAKVRIAAIKAQTVGKITISGDPL